MVKTPKESKPIPPTEPAENAVVDVGEAVEDLTEADEENFAELLATARERLEAAEKEIKWLKTQIETEGKDKTRINSTLESLSSAMTDLKSQTAEIVAKFQSLTRPPSEPNPAEPGTETPAIQTVEPATPPVVEPEAIRASPAAPEPPPRKKRFI